MVIIEILESFCNNKNVDLNYHLPLIIGILFRSMTEEHVSYDYTPDWEVNIRQKSSVLLYRLIIRLINKF